MSPNLIQKAVLGSFHQGHEKFGDTAGIQCACNALFAICFSVIKKVTIWKIWDLDYILEQGDALFKKVNISRALSIDELPQQVLIGNVIVDIEMLGNFYGILGQKDYFKNHNVFNSSNVGNGLIFTTGGYSSSIIWSKNTFVLFDSHSRDRNGCFVSNGTSVTLSFKTLPYVQQYIKSEYSQHIRDFDNTQFEYQYVNIKTDEESINTILNYLKNTKRKAKFSNNIGTSKHTEIKQKQQAHKQRFS